MKLFSPRAAHGLPSSGVLSPRSTPIALPPWVLFAPPIIYVVAWLTADGGIQSTWRAPHYYQPQFLFAIGSLLAILAAGTYSGTRSHRSARVIELDRDLVTRIRNTATGVYLIYNAVVLTVLIIGDPDLVVGTMIGRRGNALFLKARVQQQFGGFGPLQVAGMVSVSITCFLTASNRSAIRSPHLISVIVAAGVQALLLSERLQIIEILIVMLLLRAGARTGSNSSRSATRAIASRVAVLGFCIVLLFSAGEWTRNWDVKSAERPDQSFVSYIVDRGQSYFGTPVNNAAMLASVCPLEGVECPSTSFAIPAVANTREQLTGEVETGWTVVLNRFGSPEFNNAGGLLAITRGWWMLAVLPATAIVGFGLGRAYDAAKRGSIAGYLWYPPLGIAIADLFRRNYLLSTKGVAMMVATTAILVLSPRAATSS